MDKIIIKNMAFYGYHGVLSEETILGQKFFVDLEINKSLKEAGLTDDLTKSVSYAEIYERVENIARGKNYKLIEALAEAVAEDILNYFDIEGIKVRIKKPEAPIPGHFDYVGVEIERSKND
ncbi:dihydroneopterin aldolase [uncultured Ilyobacter sp.]|uniref:dihydroneopterin aldolase n=1 Tax=uncultured Ilyobacter sp. TaxID=544433 RepID=UPI002AA6FB9E|nr:dihydroneopterin aldolase [uncultured Ilyobacter sp.]